MSHCDHEPMRQEISMTYSDVQPSKWYYGLAVLILVIGSALSFWSMFSSIISASDNMTRLVAPGSADLDLQKAGGYTIFYENKSYIDGKYYSTGDDLPGLKVDVTEMATGTKIATRPPEGTFTYNLGGHSGQSIMAFQIERPGTYRISASYTEGIDGPEVVLAVGQGFAEGFLSRMMASMAGFFGSMIVALALAYLTYTRRRKAFERQREEERLVRG